jgi:transporter family-2 protein
VLIKRDKPFAKRQAWFLYIGGALGVMTVIFNNYSFMRISVSAILALMLFGQSVASLAIDQYGWLGMPKHPFNKRRIIGLLLTICGIAVMLDRFEIVAVLMSFVSGIIIVTSRTLNAKLAELSNIRISTFFNYVVGLIVCTPVFFILGSNEGSFGGIVISLDSYMYLGGVVGVCVVLISNIIVAKVPAFYLSLLVFISQVFTGVVIDALISRSFSLQILIGGILVSAGLCADLFLDRKTPKPSP